jgi:hypothetical protein
MVKDFNRLTAEGRLETGLQYGARRHNLGMLKNGWFHNQMGLR